MDTSISKLLGEGALPAELVASLQEAFDKKVTESRAEVEASIRAEFAARYDHDKGHLIEAMDKMLSDVVRKHETEKAAVVQRFVEARVAFRRAVRENRAKYTAKLTEGVQTSRKVVTEALRKEVLKLREQKKVMTAERLAAAGKLASLKESMKVEQKARLKKIDEFVIRNVKRELSEFNDDHKALVATRVKLVTESRKKLRETQTRFVKEAARNVEAAINESLTREMTQLHQDLERNRQNNFGRRVFEAIAAEFHGSYFAEGTEMRKLQKQLAEKNSKLATTTAKLDEALKVGQQATRKAKLAEDTAVRSRVMGELLSNLRGEKRSVMEGMLETVKTTALRETFSKLLPVVLDEATRKAGPSPKKPLSEAPRSRPASTVFAGGSRPAARLFETAQEETTLDRDIAQVVRLAGITK